MHLYNNKSTGRRAIMGIVTTWTTSHQRATVSHPFHSTGYLQVILFDRGKGTVHLWLRTVHLRLRRVHLWLHRVMHNLAWISIFLNTLVLTTQMIARCSSTSRRIVHWLTCIWSWKCYNPNSVYRDRRRTGRMCRTARARINIMALIIVKVRT